MALPTHPGAALQPLDLLEFLMKNPIRSVLLYEDGVAVNVPDPARYALHKATISQMRSLAGEVGKDSKEGVEHSGRTSELADAWSELWDNKAKRRSFVVRGVLALPDDAIDTIARSAIRFGAEPFREDEKPGLRSHIGANTGRSSKDNSPRLKPHIQKI